jgi:hypothetical protein
MSDEPFYSPTVKPAPARVARPGELVFEFHLEAQFLDPIEPIICRAFRPDLARRARRARWPSRGQKKSARRWRKAERNADCRAVMA